MIIKVKVIPNSKKEEIKQKDDILIIKVREKPKDNKANERLIELLSEHFKVKPYQINILKGLKSRIKIIKISK